MFAYNEFRVKRKFAMRLWFILRQRHMINLMIHRLEEILTERGRGSKARLAEAIGKPPSIITDLCKGNDRLNDDLIEAICRALKIPPWQLFVDPAKVYPEREQAIVRAYNSLTGAKKTVVDELMFPDGNGAQQEKKAKAM